MIVILTEDTSTGYRFMKLLRDKIFVTEAEVYNTAYGDLLGNGGSAKFEQAIDHLLEDGRLNPGDTLFLAFDNTIPTKPGMEYDLKAFQKQMARCERKLKNHGIACHKSSYVCIEELLLSFSHIVEFCSTPSRNKDDPELEQLKELQSIISRVGSTAYTKLFEASIAKGSTVEKCLKTLLRKITQDRGFRGFYLTDTKIGECWQYDCEMSQRSFDDRRMSYCESCYAVHKLGVTSPDLAKTRLAYLYANSLFHSVLSPLGLEVTTVT